MAPILPRLNIYFCLFCLISNSFNFHGLIHPSPKCISFKNQTSVNAVTEFRCFSLSWILSTSRLYCLSFFFPVAVDKRLKPKQLNGERAYSGLQLQTPAHHSREVPEVGASAGHIPPAGSDKCVLSSISPFG